MKKNNFFRLLSMTVGFAFLTVLSCSKDDGCENLTYYLDKDKDNFGAGTPVTACKAPTATVGQYVLKSGDTDDNDPNINPGCNLAFYLDEDNDGFGSGNPILFCKNPDDTMYTDYDEVFDCDDKDPNINPDVFITYYPDTDNDGYGDPQGQTTALTACEPIPTGFVANMDDCDDTNENANPGIGSITYYLDSDKDGYGDDSNFDTRDSCEDPPEYDYSLQGSDCDDTNANIYPGAEDMPNDGIDSNCDGAAEAIIWTGAPIQFSKAGSADWTDPQNQDQLTQNIALTRSTGGYITNISWWSNVIGQIPTESEDLPWEYLGRKAEDQPIANVGSATPNGGPQGVRWAILEKGDDNQAWDNFDQYGTLGNPANFYSLNNISSMIFLLDGNVENINIVDDFGIDSLLEEDPDDYSNLVGSHLEQRTLGVWLVEENIYFTLTFTTLSQPNTGGVMSYIRTTPSP